RMVKTLSLTYNLKMGHCYALFTFQPLACLHIALIWTFLAMKPAQTPVWDMKAFVATWNDWQTCNDSLQTHLEKNGYDINYYILAEDFSGLALIAWEHWKPQWDHNWDAKDVYRRKSRKLITEMEVSFEESAKAFMKETIALGIKSRPKGLHFCDQNYTASCPKSEVLRNNDLSWLWDISAALYPPTYIKKPLGNSYRDEPLLFISMVSFCWNNVGCIYALTILADGASGWKTSYLANSAGSSLTDLHLKPKSFWIDALEDQGFIGRGNASNEDLDIMAETLVCHCYQGYEGTDCGKVEVADDHPVSFADSVSPRRFAAI
uniref:Hyaluronidase n=1 Tax=Athene cunicularia TaxID=194338 RepID=A0A663NA61_ATHCN